MHVCKLSTGLKKLKFGKAMPIVGLWLACIHSVVDAIGTLLTTQEA